MKFFWPLQAGSWQETIVSVVAINPLAPFHPDVLSFLQSISKSILKDHAYRKYPELIALAYWIRKAHLVELQNQFNESVVGKVRLARGTALHFAPANVDTIFVYSWVLSMLAGNKNVIRISERKQEQTELLIQTIIGGLEEHPEVAKRTALVTYEHDVETSKFLSERCHVRVIWGGDETVKAIRAIPLAPLATELAFPDRFSLSVIDASAVLRAEESEFEAFIHRFYNDGFWFRQMACSSPRMVVWVGEESCRKTARSRFWERLNEYMNAQVNDYSPALQVQKLTTGYYLSGKENIAHFSHQKNFSRLKVDNIDVELREKHCGGGLFLELELQQLTDLIRYLHDKDQTLSYFGFSHEELVDFVRQIQNRSIDRIVPIGQALDFEGIWDGYDLLKQLTREVVIR